MPVMTSVPEGKLPVRSSAPVRLAARNPAQSTANADSTGRGPPKQIVNTPGWVPGIHGAVFEDCRIIRQSKEIVGFTAITCSGLLSRGTIETNMRTRHFVNFFQVGSLVMLLVATALLAAIATMHFAIHGAEVQVPALKGMGAGMVRRNRGAFPDHGSPAAPSRMGERLRQHAVTDRRCAATARRATA